MNKTFSESSRFSLKRVWEFAAFNASNIRLQLLIYLSLSLICMGLCLIPATGTVQTVIFTVVWSFLPILVNCGPLVFAIGADKRIIERQLPVSAAEKLIFYYCYILIIIPIAVYLLPDIGGWIYVNSPKLQSEEVMGLYDYKHTFMWIPTMLNVLSTMFVAMVCLYIVEHVRHNRLLWGIVAVIGSNFVLGILSGIFGAVAIVKSGFLKQIIDHPESADAALGNMDNLMEVITSFDLLTIISLLVMIILVVGTAIMTYRSLKSRNL